MNRPELEVDGTLLVMNGCTKPGLAENLSNSGVIMRKHRFRDGIRIQEWVRTRREAMYKITLAIGLIWVAVTLFQKQWEMARALFQNPF